MFEGFERKQTNSRTATINLVQGGSGYPVLLLHGYPETHVCWHRVAPLLAEQFTVVCSDLRGCGDSSKPAGDSEHLNYSKRTMAQDQVEVMQALRFNEFAVVGHDRGARVAHRLALDHKEKVTKLALLDIIPTSAAFERVDKDMAAAAFNWFFSIQPDDLPERLISADPVFTCDGFSITGPVKRARSRRKPLPNINDASTQRRYARRARSFAQRPQSILLTTRPTKVVEYLAQRWCCGENPERTAAALIEFL